MLELVVRLGISLSVVLGLFWLVARAGSRRLGGPRSLMKVHSRQSLSRTASLAVVEVGSRVLVVGVGEGGVRLLTELDPEEIAQPEADDRAGGPTLLRLPLPGRTPAPDAPAPAADGTALGGSLLSAQTWRQAWAAATQRSGVAPSTDGTAHD